MMPPVQMGYFVEKAGLATIDELLALSFDDCARIFSPSDLRLLLRWQAVWALEILWRIEFNPPEQFNT
jgi:hypothetical protein